MKRFIYKIKEKTNIQVDDEGIETYELSDIDPILVASVPVIQPKEQTTIDEDGVETTFTPEINIHTYYPKFDSELMVASESRFKEPVLVDGALTEGYVEEVVDEPVVSSEEITLTDEETLENLKQAIVETTFQLYKLEIAGFYDEELESELGTLIEAHKDLAETIAFEEVEE